MSPSRCERIRRLLSAYADDRLAPEQQRAVSLHLATCDACRAERDALDELSEVAARLPYLQPAPRLADRVRARRRASPWPTRVAAVAGLALAILGAYGLGRSHGGTEEAPYAPWTLQAEAAAVVDAARDGERGIEDEPRSPRALPAVHGHDGGARTEDADREPTHGTSRVRIEVWTRSSTGSAVPRR
ncbi:MAG: zf-HC2 domain-containing protein [Planctomycetota bacterium]